VQQQQPESLTDYLERRRPQTPDEARQLPVWLRRRMAEHQDSPFVAVKDTSEWRPDDAA
jgi:hypothetical protein